MGTKNQKTDQLGVTSEEVDQLTEPNLLKEEVNPVVQNLKKNGKPRKLQRVTNEIVKLGREVVTEIRTEIFNKVIMKEKVSNRKNLILLFVLRKEIDIK